jgi:hypothetical protein
MALTDQERQALEQAGVRVVALKLMMAGPGLGAAVRGFSCGDITRSDVEDWLAARTLGEEKQQSHILRRAKIAGIAGIVGAVIAAAALMLPFVHH